jgi:hypothetical protein
MAAIQNNLLPIYGVISHEGTKPRRIRAQRNPASNIQHPAPKPPPVLPASSKRSERVVKQSRKKPVKKTYPVLFPILTEGNEGNEVAATPSSARTDALRYLRLLL